MRGADRGASCIVQAKQCIQDTGSRDSNLRAAAALLLCSRRECHKATRTQFWCQLQDACIFRHIPQEALTCSMCKAGATAKDVKPLDKGFERRQVVTPAAVISYDSRRMLPQGVPCTKGYICTAPFSCMACTTATITQRHQGQALRCMN
jgi:hypothetical protein